MTRSADAAAALLVALLGCHAEGPRPAEILVPAGEFIMGCNSDPGCQGGNPVRRPYVPAFYIDRTLVRVQDYRRCLDAGVCTERPFVAAGPEIPISTGDIKEPSSMPKDKRDRAALVTLDAATTYCRWLGKRVPSPEEWEKAARGRDGRYSPWGNAPDHPCIGGGRPCDRIRSPYGVEEVVNQLQWADHRSDPDYPRGMGVGHSYAVYARKGTNRLYDLPHNQHFYFEVAAFRCARDADPPPAAARGR